MSAEFRELREAVADLLMHDSPNHGLSVTASEHGTFAISLFIDGWYSDVADEYGVGAQGVLPAWQGMLDRVRAALKATEERA